MSALSKESYDTMAGDVSYMYVFDEEISSQTEITPIEEVILISQLTSGPIQYKLLIL